MRPPKLGPIRILRPTSPLPVRNHTPVQEHVRLTETASYMPVSTTHFHSTEPHNRRRPKRGEEGGRQHRPAQQVPCNITKRSARTRGAGGVDVAHRRVAHLANEAPFQVAVSTSTIYCLVWLAGIPRTQGHSKSISFSASLCTLFYFKTANRAFSSQPPGNVNRSGAEESCTLYRLLGQMAFGQPSPNPTLDTPGLRPKLTPLVQLPKSL